MEIWKPIKDYDNVYEVSNMGRIRSVTRIIIQKNGNLHQRHGKIIKSHANKNNGLQQVMLVIHTHYKMHYVHRLVAVAFVDNPYNLDNVTHINGNDEDNRAENLIWCSRSQKENKKLNIFQNVKEN